MENDEHFRKAFMFFDKDGSGFIELDELREALADETGHTDADVLNDIMHEVDTDKVRTQKKICNLPSSLALFLCTFNSSHVLQFPLHFFPGRANKLR